MIAAPVRPAYVQPVTGEVSRALTGAGTAVVAVVVLIRSPFPRCRADHGNRETVRPAVSRAHRRGVPAVTGIQEMTETARRSLAVRWVDPSPCRT
ncbi:hypothetical protein Raf01_71040 [Rugosimonospora africana]|uniref:Uncharacterized protein n=1 Tax=Rugosimonospora africana TaxID=556532 RepID=A0A8J3QZJ4_9ACTN|nr:hypothetical protein Raf01_71040 [Rugosimonospora africana]